MSPPKLTKEKWGVREYRGLVKKKKKKIKKTTGYTNVLKQQQQQHSVYTASL